MKTFVYIQLNAGAMPENAKIAVYRIKKNLPVHLKTIIRSYRSPEQAVLEWLTANGHIPERPEPHYGMRNYMAYECEEKGHARIKEM